jgi:hypothetical protein
MVKRSRNCADSTAISDIYRLLCTERESPPSARPYHSAVALCTASRSLLLYEGALELEYRENLTSSLFFVPRRCDKGGLAVAIGVR